MKSANHKRSISVFLSMKKLVVLSYLLCLVGLIVWLNIENDASSESFSIVGLEVNDNNSENISLTFLGENFSKNVQGYFIEDQVSPPDILWSLLKGTPIRAIDIAGPLALVSGYQTKLISIDISDQKSPAILGSIELPAPIASILIQDGRAVVGMANDGGIAVVDLDNPSSMRLITHLEDINSVHSMVSVGASVYLVDTDKGLFRLDMSSTRPVAEFLRLFDKAWKIAGRQNYLAVGTIKGDLYLLDCSSPDEVKLLAEEVFPGSIKGAIRGVAFAGDFLTVALAGSDLMIFPLEGENTFNRSSTLKLPGVPYQIAPVFGRNSVAVSLVGAGVVVADVGADGQGQLDKQLALSTTALSFEVSNEVLYASGMGAYKGLNAINFEELQSFQENESIFVDDQYYLLASWENNLYGYGRDGALLEIDVATTTDNLPADGKLMVPVVDGVAIYEVKAGTDKLVRKGSYVTPDRFTDALALGDALFISHRTGLDVYQGQNENDKKLVTGLDVSGHVVQMLNLGSNCLLLVTLTEGIKVVDVSDIRAPVVISRLLPPTHLKSSNVARGLVLHDSVAYLSQGSAGIYAVDVSEPKDIKMRHFLDTPGVARKMAIKDNLLFVADGNAGIYMVDISNPLVPIPVGSLPTPVAVKEIAVTDNAIIASGHPGGTLKLPLPKKLSNVRVDGYDRLKADVDRLSKGGFAYLYNESTHQRIHVAGN